MRRRDPRTELREDDAHGRPVRPIGSAFISVVVALLVGAVVNGQALMHVADQQPLGWRRTTARIIAHPFSGFGNVTHLSSPRRYAAKLVGSPTFDGAGHEPKIVVPVGPPPSTTTTIPKDPPVVIRTPTTAEPLHVHFAGDSFLKDVSLGFSRLIGDDDRFKLTTDGQVGTGLVRPDVIDWPARLEEKLPSDAEVVVVGWGGNDAQGMIIGRQRADPGDQPWLEEYRRRVDRVLDAITARDRTVLWVGVPVTSTSNIEKARLGINSVVQDEVAKHPNARFVDPTKVLSPDGLFTALLKIDGEDTRIRNKDGYHLTLPGARLVGTEVYRAIGAIWPLEADAVATATTTTAAPASG